MPANLSPEYLAAEERYKQAKATPEKIAALEEMLSAIPKHKGTEKMQAEIKRKLSRLRGEKKKKTATKKAPPIYLVEREGAGQVALVGPPNSGKSSLVRRLTHATPEVADYPFCTRLPLPAMMPFENIQIQLIDLPPLHPDFPEHWVPQAIRNADAVALVIDLGEAAVLEQLTETLAQLEQGKIAIGPPPQELPRGYVHRPALLVGNKCDRPGARDNYAILAELWKDRFRLLSLSTQTGENLDVFPRAVFELLGIVRIYTKVPGKKADLNAPFVVPRGATVRDVAERVHKDFVARLKFARLWGGGRFDGQMVQRDYIVEDNDVLELHL
jgi:ribosome-interacting GTPase 1